MTIAYTRGVAMAAALALAFPACDSAGGSSEAMVAVSSPARQRDIGHPHGLFCTIVGTQANEVLAGTLESDVICGGAGDDTVIGGRGDDILIGGSGRDILRGGLGADALSGAGGADRLWGGRGNDRLRGGDESDALVDAAGRDRLVGGDGRDTLRTRDRRPYDLVVGGRDIDLCVADAGDRRVGCWHPLVASHDRRVPVLMYHMIGDPPPGAPFGDLWVSASTFAAQMRYLDRHSYHVVNLQDVYDYWHGGPLLRKAVVVSFDDGFHAHYGRARPILVRHGWSGTLNLALTHLGPDLSRAEIRALLGANWELDSHTLTHAYLPGLGATALRAQVARSRRILRRRFHVPVNFFCYPYGAYDRRVIAAVRAAGYRGATTIDTVSLLGVSRSPWTASVSAAETE